MGSRGDQHSDMGLHNRSESVMNSASSAMSTNLFFASAWDPIVSLSRHGTFGGSSVVSQGEFTNSPYPVVMETQGICSTSHLGHYQSDSSFVEPMPRFPCFGNGGFSGMAGSFGLGECGHIANSECHPNYMLTKDCNNERSLANAVQSQEDHQVVEDEDAAVGAAPNGKRRKRVAESNSPFDRNKDAEGELLRDPSGDSSDVPREQDEKRPKTEQNLGANLRGKQAAKQTKDNGEAPKENYVHVRARRGQATNSHSLAERVRREKISERMRLLQELVPGCSKITGKAVMLDEIINYVQSLQHQVEFLSMKLATVNPELNIDIERILSKEILHSRGGNASVLGFNPGMNSHPYSHGIFQGSMPVIPNTSSQFSPVPQTALDNELQSLFHMGFDTSSALNSFGPNGRLKPEL